MIYHSEKKEKIKSKADNDKADNGKFIITTVKRQYKSKQMASQPCFQRKDPLKLVLARIAALGSLPFYKLEKNRDMQHLFRRQGLKIPSSNQSMRQKNNAGEHEDETFHSEIIHKVTANKE